MSPGTSTTYRIWSTYLFPPVFFFSVISNAHSLYTRGGEEVLVDHGGKDASAAFEDVGHSPEARQLLDSLTIGVLEKQV